MDKDGRVTVWNKCAARITGFSASEVINHDLVNEFIQADFRASVQQVLLDALNGEDTENCSLPFMTKDGRRLEILLSATARFDNDGVIIGVVGIGQDITTRLAQEQEYSRLIDAANAPIFGVDASGRERVEQMCPDADWLWHRGCPREALGGRVCHLRIQNLRAERVRKRGQGR